MQYQPLIAGAIRQDGDEQQNKAWPETRNRFGDVAQRAQVEGPWKPVDLLGPSILAADLLHLNFRRPIK